MIRREAEKAGYRQSAIVGGEELARGPDKDISVPYGRETMFGHGIDLHFCIAGFVEDRRDASGLRQREEGALHEVALVTRQHGSGQRLTRIEARAFALTQWSMVSGHACSTTAAPVHLLGRPRSRGDRKSAV